MIHKKPTVVGAATGAILGLVAITPGAGFVSIPSAILIGMTVSPICFFFMAVVKKKFKYDDALDAFGCHGIGGIWGAIATGIFAEKAINPIARWDGLLHGDWELFVAQVLSVLITVVVSAVGTFLIASLIKIFVPLRVSVQEEKVGLDASLHGENAYPSFNGLD